MNRLAGFRIRPGLIPRPTPADIKPRMINLYRQLLCESDILWIQTSSIHDKHISLLLLTILIDKFTNLKLNQKVCVNNLVHLNLREGVGRITHKRSST